MTYEWFGTAVGLGAAICTTASYVPQVKKTWTTGETGDLSIQMLILLSMGLALWIAYGVITGDVVIVLANATSLALLSVIIYFKVSADRQCTVSRSGHGSATRRPRA